MEIQLISRWTSADLAYCDYYEYFSDDVCDKLYSFNRSHSCLEQIRLFDVIIEYIGVQKISLKLFDDIISSHWDDILTMYDTSYCASACVGAAL